MHYAVAQLLCMKKCNFVLGLALVKQRNNCFEICSLTTHEHKYLHKSVNDESDDNDDTTTVDVDDDDDDDDDNDNDNDD